MNSNKKCLSPTECNGVDCLDNIRPVTDQPLIYRLRKRAEIRRQIQGRKSVEEGTPDRIADLLEEAADEINKLEQTIANLVSQRLDDL